MRVSFLDHIIELHSWQKKTEMMVFLKSCNSGSVLLGEEAEASEFYSAMIRLSLSGLQSFGVGICSEGHGLIPHLLPVTDGEMLLFGYNQEVSAVCLKNKVVLWTIKLDSLFSSFLHLREKEMILVFHEIGVFAIRESGQVLWRYEDDIIVDVRVDHDSLHLEFMDSAPACLPLLSRELQCL
jgi:hypothetical protein